MSEVSLRDIEQAAKTILDAFNDWKLPYDISKRFKEVYDGMSKEISEQGDDELDNPSLLYMILEILSGEKDDQ